MCLLVPYIRDKFLNNPDGEKEENNIFMMTTMTVSMLKIVVLTSIIYYICVFIMSIITSRLLSIYSNVRFRLTIIPQTLSTHDSCEISCTGPMHQEDNWSAAPTSLGCLIAVMKTPPMETQWKQWDSLGFFTPPKSKIMKHAD